MPKYTDITGLLEANPGGIRVIGRHSPGVLIKGTEFPVERGEIVHVRPRDAAAAKYIQIKAESICSGTILGSIDSESGDKQQDLVLGAKVKITHEYVYCIMRK